MVPPHGHWNGTVQVPAHVCTFSDEIVMVDACAAALSPQRDGAAFSRAAALRIAALEGRKDRQARGTPAPPRRQGSILAALTAAGTPGLRPAEVRQATGLPQGTVASALHGLVPRGQVRTVHDRSVATGPERAAGP